MQTGSPDEIAHMAGWISDADLDARAALFGKNSYGSYLRGLIKG
jgi:glucose-1-phosphate thymidylyltransferase